MPDPNQIRAGNASIEFHADLSKIQQELSDNASITRQLNESFGRGSEFTQFARILSGAGPVIGLSLVATAVDKIGTELDKAAKNGDNMGVALLKGLPIVSTLYEGIKKIADAIDGTTASTANWEKQVKLLDDAWKSIHKSIDDSKQVGDQLGKELADVSAIDEQTRAIADADFERKKHLEEIAKLQQDVSALAAEELRVRNAIHALNERGARNADPMIGAERTDLLATLAQIQKARSELNTKIDQQTADAQAIYDAKVNNADAKAQDDLDKQKSKDEEDLDKQVTEDIKAQNELDADYKKQQFDQQMKDAEDLQKNIDDFNKRAAEDQKKEQSAFEKQLSGVSHFSVGTFNPNQQFSSGYSFKTRSEQDIAVIRDLFQRLWSRMQTGQAGLILQ